jgi:hypothetical protein
MTETAGKSDVRRSRKQSPTVLEMELKEIFMTELLCQDSLSVSGILPVCLVRDAGGSVVNHNYPLPPVFL